MSKYGNQLFHYETQENLTPHPDICCGDNTYEMLPDNTLIHCQLIDHYGKDIKSDGSFGQELVWARVCDQRCFLSNILYYVQIINNNCEDNFYTRTTKINWPRPTEHNNIPFECILDNSIDGPLWSLGCVECDCCGEKDIDPNELDSTDVNLSEIGGGYAHEGCMSSEMLKEYEKSMEYEVSSDIENPEEEYTDKLDADKVKQHLVDTLLNQGVTESQAKLMTSGVLGMDEHNLKIANVMAEKSMEEAAKQMFVHPTEGRKMSYSEMRSFYG